MKSSGVKRAIADLQKCSFSERKFEFDTFRFVKLHLPPPEIRIFSPIAEFRSMTATALPRFPASIAHINPAAPPPITITSWVTPFPYVVENSYLNIRKGGKSCGIKKSWPYSLKNNCQDSP